LANDNYQQQQQQRRRQLKDNNVTTSSLHIVFNSNDHTVTDHLSNKHNREDISQSNQSSSQAHEEERGSASDVCFGSMRAPLEPLKLMLIFDREDAQSDAWLGASRKIGHQVTLVCSFQPDVVLKKMTELDANLIVVDRRLSNRAPDADILCRSIRSQPGGHYPIVLAVIKRSYMEREEYSVANLLHVGYDRCLAESGSVGACLNELIMVHATEFRSRQRLRLAEALIAVADSTRELVTVTDGQFNIRYANSGVERLLGYTADEMIGKNMIELFKSDSNRFDINEAAQQIVQKNKEWDGTCSCRRKTGDSVALYSRMIASNSKNRFDVPDYVMMLQEPLPLLIDKSLSGDIGNSDYYPLPRSSLHSVRKASYDVRSLGSDAVIRRQSLARLHSMAIEGPITKAMNIIATAQESCPNYVSQALEKVLDILRSTELFTPHLEVKGRSEDPVTTDLVGALLLGQKPSGYIRRSSNESGTKSPHNPLFSRPLLPSLNNITIPIQLREMLENDSQWEFDVIRLEKLTGKRPLVWLGMTIMTGFEVPRTLNCDEATLQNWLTVIEANYHVGNTYHNSTHAADVLQATAFFLQRNRIKPLLDSLDQAACLIAAAIHDLDHPGKTSGFLCNSGSELAILYNDLSVLESHHAALAFKLTHHDDRVNIFKGLDRETYKALRQSIIDMVLATEMTKHFEHLTKFINIFAKPFIKEDDNQSEASSQEIDYAGLNTAENIILVKRMLIKCADVSNPTRPLNLCIEWARRIAEEYFNQTADEKAQGLPVVMPQFDRLTCSIPKSQIGFTDYFIADMFDAWDAFAEVPELLQYMKKNYQFWKDQEASGVTGLPAEYTIPQTPTDLVRKIEFETLAECKETLDS